MSESMKCTFYQKFGKRVLDIILSLFLIIILSPVILVTALLVRLFLGSPVLFRQKRPGRNCEIFTIWKFRTMTDERDASGNLLPDGERLTAFGRFLRKTSLDETPQLFHILSGKMSFIGPRPLLTDYLPRYTEEQLHRHDVTPGLTGWAQVNGRNAVSWEERFQMDLWYVRHVSFALDVKILFMTVFTVISHRGVSSNTSETMEEFMGGETADTEQNDKNL